jgi:hypothetical protein
VYLFYALKIGNSMLFLIVISMAVLLLGALVTIYKMSETQAELQSKCMSGVPTAPPQVVGSYTRPQDLVVSRDRAVVENVLYPPVSRDTRDNTLRLLSEPRLLPDRDDSDQYQLVGYLTNSGDKSDVWKLVARSRGRSQADFYAQSSNRNIDVKIPLGDQVAKSADGSNTRPFRDMYDLPDAVVINHPMFESNAVYSVVRLPRAELGSGYV